ncbi:MAG TPA: hypothetical protein VFM91_04630 [Propionibacteriaceae bacterium]|nr:hypothetical protein [Propionibacteriaceae bacterium]
MPPSSSELTERKSVFRNLLLQIGGANIENPAAVVARTGSRAAVLRRSESTRFSSASDDKGDGFPARSAASGGDARTRS